MSRPHIVIVPGAWHDPEAFESITKKLVDYGYTVHCRTMPAVGNEHPPKDLTEDVEALQGLVTQAIGDGNDVLVIPHSWGGIITGNAMVGYGKKQREDKGQKGGVVKLGYMCSFIVPEGVSLLNACQDQIPPWYTVEGPYCVVREGQAPFYNDLPPEEQKKWMAKLKTHSFATMEAKATGAAWREIPTSYLLCEDDLAIPAFAQEMMANSVKDMGGDIEIERIKASHSPFLSQPDTVVNWIRRIAGEKI